MIAGRGASIQNPLYFCSTWCVFKSAVYINVHLLVLHRCLIAAHLLYWPPNTLPRKSAQKNCIGFWNCKKSWIWNKMLLLKWQKKICLELGLSKKKISILYKINTPFLTPHQCLFCHFCGIEKIIYLSRSLQICQSNLTEANFLWPTNHRTEKCWRYCGPASWPCEANLKSDSLNEKLRLILDFWITPASTTDSEGHGRIRHGSTLD